MVKWFQTQREAVRTGAGSGGAWRCAGVAVLTLVVFIGLNIAGCGGGGGGGSSPVTPAPQSRSITLALRDVNGNATNGAITLKGGSVNTTLNTVNSRATFQNVPAGTYQVTLNINGTVSTTSLAVTNEAGQVFVVSPSGSGTITISGRVLLNPNNGSTAQCSTGGQGVTARVIIRVRDLNPTAGNAIVFSYIKPDQSNVSAQQQGFYVVHLSRPGTYRVEARPTSDNVGAPFSGNSASFTVGPSQTVVANLDICANQCAVGQSACAPGGTPPAPPGTPTPGATGIPGGPTATPAPTVTPGGPATPTPAPTATPGSGPTATPGGGGQPTPTTAATSTPVPTNTPVPTPIPGQPTFTPAPTNTPVSGPVPTQPGGSLRAYRNHNSH